MISHTWLFDHLSICMRVKQAGHSYGKSCQYLTLIIRLYHEKDVKSMSHFHSSPAYCMFPSLDRAFSLFDFVRLSCVISAMPLLCACYTHAMVCSLPPYDGSARLSIGAPLRHAESEEVWNAVEGSAPLAQSVQQADRQENKEDSNHCSDITS